MDGLDPDERALLDAILADPDDDGPRLVYADWLEERGDERATYLRLEIEFRSAADAIERDRVERALRRLRWYAGAEWLAIVARLPIENCPRTDCPGRWEQLSATDAPEVRRCETCLGIVHHCASFRTTRDRAAERHPVVVNTWIPRSRPIRFGPNGPVLNTSPTDPSLEP